MNDTAERASSRGQEERQTHSRAQAVSQAHKERAKGLAREARGQGEGGGRKSFFEHIRAYGGRGGASSDPDEGGGRKSFFEHIRAYGGRGGASSDPDEGGRRVPGHQQAPEGGTRAQSIRDQIDERAGSTGSRITERINSARSRAGS